MKIFASNGLKISCPDSFEIAGDFSGQRPFVILSDTRQTNNLELRLNRVQTIEYLHQTNRELAGLDHPGTEVVKNGPFHGFAGSREVLARHQRAGLTTILWLILIPTDRGIVDLKVIFEKNGDLGLDEFYDLWQPVAASLEIDVDRLPAPPPGEPASGTVNFCFGPSFGFVAFYDSGQESMPEVEITDKSVRQKIIKLEKWVYLYPDDALDVLTDFIPGPPPPGDDLAAWAHVVEGIIDIGSGKLYATDDIVAQLEIPMTGGNYRFRVCFTEVDVEADSCELHIYLWSTEEPETNEIQVLKQQEEL